MKWYRAADDHIDLPSLDRGTPSDCPARPDATGEIVYGTGHMGPIPHADLVSDRLVVTLPFVGDTTASKAV
jgi:hypothetical protein